MLANISTQKPMSVGWIGFGRMDFWIVIKEKSEDPTRYGDPHPELNYLVRMSEKDSGKSGGDYAPSPNIFGNV